MFRVLLLTLGVIFIIPIGVLGQTSYANAALEEGYRLVETGKALSAMPTSGKRPEDFLPRHWKVFAKAEGDLNRNGINDAVLILQLDPEDRPYLASLPGGKDAAWPAGAYMIVTLLDKPNKTLEFDEVNYSIGAIPQNPRDQLTVEVKNGVVSIYSSTGGTLRFDETYRFREDPPTGGFLTLIGYDFEEYSVANEPERIHYRLSENYLTGERVEITTSFDKRGNEIGGQPKKTAFKPEKTGFSEVRPKVRNY